MDSGGRGQQVDLDNLINEFMQWQKAMREAAHGNSCLKLQIRAITKRLHSSQEAEKNALEEADKLKEIVDKLQSVLSKGCDLEEENAEMKSHITAMKDRANDLEQEHKNQMSEALKNLEASDKAHRQELLRIKEEAVQQSKRELSAMEKSLQEKTNEIRQLHKQLADLDQEKHTEIVKLRLEYDAKLLKLQRFNSKIQGGQTATANNDIFRKKLQFARAEAAKEIISLKSKVADLERKLAQTPQLPTKKKRF